MIYLLQQDFTYSVVQDEMAEPVYEVAAPSDVILGDPRVIILWVLVLSVLAAGFLLLQIKKDGVSAWKVMKYDFTWKNNKWYVLSAVAVAFVLCILYLSH